MSSRPPSSFSPPRLTELALDRPNHTLVQHSSVPFSNLKVTLEYKRRHESGGEVEVLSKEHRVILRRSGKDNVTLLLDRSSRKR